MQLCPRLVDVPLLQESTTLPSPKVGCTWPSVVAALLQESPSDGRRLASPLGYDPTRRVGGALSLFLSGQLTLALP